MRFVAISSALAFFATVCFGLDITTSDGTTYNKCEVTKVEADAIVITYLDGIARIPAEKLPSTLQAEYHFDLQKVADYRKHTAKTQVVAEPVPLAITSRLSDAWSALPPGAQLIGAVTLGAIALIVFFSATNSLKRRSHFRRICRDAMKYLKSIEREHSMPIVPTDIILESDERAYYCAPATLFETRAVRHYQSGFAGFRVAKGIWIGGSKGRSISNQELGQIDSGTLTVTTYRIIFDGNQNRNINLGKIISIKPYSDSVEVSVSNRQKSMFFTAENPHILYHIIRLANDGWDTISRIGHDIPLNE